MKIKRDKYSRVRPGPSKILEISCSKCKTEQFLYQKDGYGDLIRLYVDRIQPFTKEEIAFDYLNCKNCNFLLAVPFLYEKEKRPALLVIKGRIKKSVLK